MRARRSASATREDYDGFDMPPPEVFDVVHEAPADDTAPDLAAASLASISAPVHVCLVCGADPSAHSVCLHFEVATVTVLSPALHDALGELRAHTEALRDLLRTVRRLTATAAASGDAVIAVREAPTVAPRVVLIPPAPSRRPRRPFQAETAQGRFGFAEAPTSASDAVAVVSPLRPP